MTAVTPRSPIVGLQHRVVRLCARSIRISHQLKDHRADPTGGNTGLTDHLRRPWRLPSLPASSAASCTRFQRRHLAGPGCYPTGSFRMGGMRKLPVVQSVASRKAIRAGDAGLPPLHLYARLRFLFSARAAGSRLHRAHPGPRLRAKSRNTIAGVSGFGWLSLKASGRMPLPCHAENIRR